MLNDKKENYESFVRPIWCMKDVGGTLGRPRYKMSLIYLLFTSRIKVKAYSFWLGQVLACNHHRFYRPHQSSITT